MDADHVASSSGGDTVMHDFQLEEHFLLDIPGGSGSKLTSILYSGYETTSVCSCMIGINDRISIPNS